MLASHKIVSPGNCRHPKSVVHCPVCDEGQIRCIRCHGIGEELSLKSCASRLVGARVRDRDGRRGIVVSAMSNGVAVQVDFDTGVIRRIALDLLTITKIPGEE